MHQDSLHHPLAHHRGLLEVSRLLASDQELELLLDQITRLMAESIGFRIATINLYRPAWDDFSRAAACGVDDQPWSRGQGTTKEMWTACLDDRFLRRGAYLIKAGELEPDPANDGNWLVPDIPVPADERGWHPDDALLVPMMGSDDNLIGVISVDDPISGQRPTDDQIDVLVALSQHAAAVVEHAQEMAASRQNKAALEHLFGLSVQLSGAFSLDVLFRSVCEGIVSALGFRKAAIELVDPGTGCLTARATVGWVNRPSTLFTIDEIAGLIDPQFEVEGCYLLPSEEAQARVRHPHVEYRSEMNGRGPHAWDHHWLAVPLFDHGGGLIGTIWVDDPEDRLLPSRELLQTLRMFANQVTTALDSVSKFEAVSETKDMLQALVQASPLGIVALDLRGNVTLWSPAATEVFGWKEEDVVGRPLAALGSVEGFALTIDEGMRGETVWGREFSMVRGDGTEVRFSVSAAPLHSGEGEVVGAVCVVADITERRRLDEALQQRQKLESIGILAGGIAHDFNNLLVGILGNASLALQDVEPGSPLQESVEGIELAARRAAEMTWQMLAYSGQGQFVVKPIDLSELVDETVRLLETVVSKRAYIRFALAHELPQIQGDSSQIQQVIMNLVMNASEALDGAGDITIRTGMVEVDAAAIADEYTGENIKPGPYTFVEVADTGPGIPPEIRARIFDPFFTTKFTGRGLGLAAVLGIVRAHGGVLKLTSEMGEGTTFRILLPAVEAAARPKPRPIRIETSVSPSGSVLVVDDEEMVRRLASTVLRRANIDVAVAEDGETALEVFRSLRDGISVVLLDLTMPGLGVREIFDRLLEMDDRIRVILTSGYSEQEVMREFASGSNVAGFLQKPYRAEQLVHAIKDALAESA